MLVQLKIGGKLKLVLVLKNNDNTNSNKNNNKIYSLCTNFI